MAMLTGRAWPAHVQFTCDPASLAEAGGPPSSGRKRVVTAFEARKLECDEVRMPGRELRRPHFVIGARRVTVFPDILDLERAADRAGADFPAEQTLEQVLVEGQRALGEHGIPELLELLENLVIQPRIVMVRTGEDDDPDSVLAFELVDDGARLCAYARLVGVQLAEAHLDCASVFLR